MSESYLAHLTYGLAASTMRYNFCQSSMDRKLTIRAEQMEVFRRHMDHQFATQIAQDIRHHRVGRSDELSDTELSRLVEAGIARARTYGFTRKYPIAMFIHVMLIVGPDFDEYPPVRLTLLDQRFPPNQRMDRLLDAMTPELWERAKRRNDSNTLKV